MSGQIEKTILAVDDTAITLRTYQVIFGDSMKVLLAKSPDRAMGVLASEWVDLILLDYEMPEMSGMDFLRLLKSRESTKNIPVILVTSHVTTDLIAAAKAAGAVSYVMKPFDTGDLAKRALAAMHVTDALVTPEGKIVPVPHLE
jgi:CheY-like chemotaxis protein